MIFVLGGTANLSLAMDERLEKIQFKLVREYLNVSHINASQFSKMNVETTVVFDVREKEEFAVSHITGAIQLDPKQKVDEFLARYNNEIQGKTVVFYCSVGRRSSAMVSKLQEKLEQTGVVAAFNLTGGLFNWRNENKPLVSGGHETDLIHPYNFYWGRLVHDNDAISYKH